MVFEKSIALASSWGSKSPPDAESIFETFVFLSPLTKKNLLGLSFFLPHFSQLGCLSFRFVSWAFSGEACQNSALHKAVENFSLFSASHCVRSTVCPLILVCQSNKLGLYILHSLLHLSRLKTLLRCKGRDQLTSGWPLDKTVIWLWKPWSLLPMDYSAIDKYRDPKKWFCSYSIIATTEHWKWAMSKEVCHWDQNKQIFAFFFNNDERKDFWPVSEKKSNPYRNWQK